MPPYAGRTFGLPGTWLEKSENAIRGCSIESDEGDAVHCPAFPGCCWSQGNTHDEALVNIRDAIAEYLGYLADRAAARKAEALEAARAGRLS